MNKIIEIENKKYELIGENYELIKENVDERIIFFNKWSDEKYCIEAVKQNGNSLRFVKEQTKKICLKAVKQNRDSLQYVKNKLIFEKITGLKLKDKLMRLKE